MDTLRVCQAESTARQPIRSSNPTNPASTLRIDEWGACMCRSSQEPGPLHNGTSEDICDDRIALPARPLPFRAGEAFAVTVIGRLKFQCLNRVSEIVRKSSPLRDTLRAVPVTASISLAEKTRPAVNPTELSAFF